MTQLVRTYIRRVLTEHKFVFDGNTVKLLGKQGKSRDYGHPDNFGGTADWMFATDKRVYVVDYKTGVEKDPCCAQMRILAGFAYEYFALPVTTLIVNLPVSKFPARNRAAWYSHKTKHEIFKHEYDLDGSTSCAAFMRDIYSRVQAERDKAKQGLPIILVKDTSKQCKYCNSKKFCKEFLTDTPESPA